MSKQVITLSDKAAQRVKEIMAQAKETFEGHLKLQQVDGRLHMARNLSTPIPCLWIS